MTDIVVDTSVAAKWYIEEPDSERAWSILEAATTVHAPDIIHVELANVLTRRVRLGDISADQRDRALLHIDTIVTHRVRSRTLLPLACFVADDFQHPVYDCLFIACAITEGISLATADRRLATIADRSTVALVDF